jgi:hypothetical protein
MEVVTIFLMLVNAVRKAFTSSGSGGTRVMDAMAVATAPKDVRACAARLRSEPPKAVAARSILRMPNSAALPPC